MWPHYNSERRILPDVLNLQLDQRKFIVSEQFIEVGLVTNNDGGGGESIVYAQEEEIHSGHDWLVYLPDLGPQLDTFSGNIPPKNPALL